MVSSYLSPETRASLLRHQRALEAYEFIDWDKPDWEKVCDEYESSIKQLQECDEPEIRRLARLLDISADPAGLSEDLIQTMRDAEHDLVRLGLKIADQRPASIKQQFN